MKKTIKKTRPAKLGQTNRSRVKPSLENSELRYRRLFETAQDGILILDAMTGAITDVNPYLIAMLGYSREEFIEKKIWQVGAFKDIEASKDAFEALQKNKYIRYENLPLKTKDGRLIQVEFVSNVYLVGEEQVIQCNIRDITEHKRLVAALQENKKKYHTLVTQFPDGIFLIDLSGNILSVNQAICDGLGFSEEEFRSMNIWDLVPDQYLDQYKTRLTKILNGESLIEPSEYLVRGKDGKIVYIEVISAPYYSEKGIIGFQGIARDITARKRAEEALAQERNMLRTLIDNIPDYIYVKDTQGRFVVGNTALAQSFGKTAPGEIAGKTDFDFHPPELAPQYFADEREIFRTGQPLINREELVIESTGKQKWVITTKMPLRDEQGVVVGLVGIGRDLTARKQAETALRESEERYRLLVETLLDGVVVHSEGRVVFANPASARIIGAASWAELIGKPVIEFVHPEHRELALKRIKQSLGEGRPAPLAEEKFIRLDGTPIDVEVSAIPFSYVGKPAMLTVFNDITERKRAEEERTAHIRFLESLARVDQAIKQETNVEQMLWNIVKTVFSIFDCDRAWLFYPCDPDAPSFRVPVEITKPEYPGAEVLNVDLPMAPDMAQNLREALASDDPVIYIAGTEKPINQVTADQFSVQSQMFVALYPKLGKPWVFGMHQCSYPRIWTNEERNLFKEISRRISDGLGGVLFLRELQENEKRFRALYEDNPSMYFTVDLAGTVLSVNPFGCAQLGYTAQELVGQSVLKVFHEEDKDAAARSVARCVKNLGQVFHWELRKVRQTGSVMWVKETARAIREPDGQVVVFMVCEDITERKRAEEALRQSKRSLTEAQRVGRLGSWDWDAKTDTITWSEEYYSIYGFTPTQPPPGYEEHLKAYTPESATRLDAVVKQSMQTGESYEVDLEQTRADGTRRWVTARGECKRDAHGQIVGLRGTALDITERKQREIQLQAIATMSAALRTAPTRAEMLPVILDQLLALLNADGAALVMRDPASGDTVVEGARGEFTKGLCARLAPGEGVSGLVIASGKPFVTSDIRGEAGIALPDVFETVRAVACIPLTVQDQVIGAVWVGRQSEISADEVRLLTAIADIASNAIQRETLHEKTERQLDFLKALHNIDVAITASMDLQVTLNILLEHVKTQLNADATIVLLLNHHSQMLEYAAGCGFCTHSAQAARIRLGEEVAGRAALERRTIHAVDPEQIQDSRFAARWAGESFAAYSVVPLIAKGQVKGVLEVFHRVPFHPTPDWISFLETLAGQAAIAIDSAQLFDHMQRSNMDLALAYDDTIEGWSRALDLRDKETEGHTQRVTEITLRLAKAMGIGDAELVHIRRGALLHDIGKMGVPDSILLKPDKLTNEEWKLMRMHPQLAYNLISPINYLRPALDIPYCHHEKWDGTGYPRGLEGEQIPLAARIFAVVDVWDALRTDRPYRAAWSEDIVLEYIRSQAGTHFDPQVVKVCLESGVLGTLAPE